MSEGTDTHGSQVIDGICIEHVEKISHVFKPTHGKTGAIPKSIVQKIWKNRLAPRFYSTLMNVMFPENSKEVSFLSFYTIYQNLALSEAEVTFRALTIYHIATIHEPPFNYEQADEYPNASYKNIKDYVCDVITSYLHAITYTDTKEALGWIDLKSTNTLSDGNLVAAYLLKDLEKHRNEVSIGSLEVWLQKNKIYYAVSEELFRFLFGVSPLINPLIPLPIVYTGINTKTVLALPSVLLFNSKLPKRASKWTLAYVWDNHSREWETFKQVIYGKSQTFIVIQDSHGHIFGMYASQRWYPSNQFYGDADSFLFTIKPDINIYEASGRDQNFQIFTEFGIGMGGSEEKLGLMLSQSLRTGTTSLSCRTFQEFWPLSSDLVFKINHLEVWLVGEVSARPCFTDEEESCSISDITNHSKERNLEIIMSDKELTKLLALPFRQKSLSLTGSIDKCHPSKNKYNDHETIPSQCIAEKKIDHNNHTNAKQQCRNTEENKISNDKKKCPNMRPSKEMPVCNQSNVHKRQPSETQKCIQKKQEAVCSEKACQEVKRPCITSSHLKRECDMKTTLANSRVHSQTKKSERLPIAGNQHRRISTDKNTTNKCSCAQKPRSNIPAITTPIHVNSSPICRPANTKINSNYECRNNTADFQANDDLYSLRNEPLESCAPVKIVVGAAICDSVLHNSVAGRTLDESNLTTSRREVRPRTSRKPFKQLHLTPDCSCKECGSEANRNLDIENNNYNNWSIRQCQSQTDKFEFNMPHGKNLMSDENKSNNTEQFTFSKTSSNASSSCKSSYNDDAAILDYQIYHPIKEVTRLVKSCRKYVANVFDSLIDDQPTYAKSREMDYTVQDRFNEDTTSNEKRRNIRRDSNCKVLQMEPKSHETAKQKAQCNRNTEGNYQKNEAESHSTQTSNEDLSMPRRRGCSCKWNVTKGISSINNNEIVNTNYDELKNPNESLAEDFGVAKTSESKPCHCSLNVTKQISSINNNETVNTLYDALKNPKESLTKDFGIIKTSEKKPCHCSLSKTWFPQFPEDLLHDSKNNSKACDCGSHTDVLFPTFSDQLLGESPEPSIKSPCDDDLTLPSTAQTTSHDEEEPDVSKSNCPCSKEDNTIIILNVPKCSTKEAVGRIVKEMDVKYLDGTQFSNILATMPSDCGLNDVSGSTNKLDGPLNSEIKKIEAEASKTT